MTSLSESAGTRPNNKMSTIVLACASGTALEWYDFFIYGLFAATVFGQLFFPPGTDPLVGTLGAFAGFATGYVARPLGGMFFAHIGDRYGRRGAMVGTLMIMGASTFLMGLLPTYEQVGLLAPLLLVVLRIAQGLAAGGEWGGAALMLTENAPATRKGFYSSFLTVGSSGGFLLAAVAFGLTQRMPHAAFLEWGWRIPFLVSVVIFGVGIFVRSRVKESEEFTAIEKQGLQVRLPLVEVIKKHPKALLIATGLRFGENGASVIYAFFTFAYAKHLGIPNEQIIIAQIISFVIQLPCLVGFGALSDRIGVWPIYFFGAVGMTAFAYPFFLLLDTKMFPAILTALIVGNVLFFGSMNAVQPKIFQTLFPAELRYSGIAFGHEVASIFSGGLSPVIATALLSYYEQSLPIALYFGLLGLTSVVTLLFARPGRVTKYRSAQAT